jgi:hypothetical protein
VMRLTCKLPQAAPCGMGSGTDAIVQRASAVPSPWVKFLPANQGWVGEKVANHMPSLSAHGSLVIASLADFLWSLETTALVPSAR